MNNDTQAYRMTTLGLTLQETLDEMIQTNNLKNELAQRVLIEFDNSINRALSTKMKNKISFKVTEKCYLENEKLTDFSISRLEI